MILPYLGACFWGWNKFKNLCLSRYWSDKFGHAGTNLSIGSAFNCYRPDLITVHDGVVIANGVTLRAVTHYPWGGVHQSFSPSITLMRGCFINNGTHITATTGITIGENVMIAENCFIADHSHEYRDTNTPIKRQPLASKGPLTIGQGAWIGTHCTIIGSLSIGRNTVVGSNSVVTSSLPDYCVAVGAPARIIRIWNPQTGLWVHPNATPEAP